jgi:hypothetical protein
MKEICIATSLRIPYPKNEKELEKEKLFFYSCYLITTENCASNKYGRKENCF